MNIHKFWQSNGIGNYLLYPLTLLWRAGTYLRSLQRPHKSSLFVICLGNINVGGAGKTPTAIKLGKLLKAKNYKVAYLTKGYGGSLRGAVFINENYNAKETGDEPLLLNNILPTVVAKNLQEGLLLLEETNFDIAILDDGFQNPTIVKDYNILIVNGNYGFGNQHLLPRGPLRESINNGFKKAQAIVLLEEDKKNIKELVSWYKKPLFIGTYEAIGANDFYEKEFVVFCGIGIPNKFKNTLEKYNVIIKEFIIFKDHYSYSEEDIKTLIKKAKDLNVKLLTTEKDYVKIQKKYQADIIAFKIEAKIENEEKLIGAIIEEFENAKKNKG